MRNFIVGAIFVMCAVPAFAARLPGPYPSDEPAEPPPPTRDVVMRPADDGDADQESRGKKKERPAYEETSKYPTRVVPR